MNYQKLAPSRKTVGITALLLSGAFAGAVVAPYVEPYIFGQSAPTTQTADNNAEPTTAERQALLQICPASVAANRSRAPSQLIDSNTMQQLLTDNVEKCVLRRNRAIVGNSRPVASL